MEKLCSKEIQAPLDQKFRGNLKLLMRVLSTNLRKSAQKDKEIT